MSASSWVTDSSSAISRSRVTSHVPYALIRVGTGWSRVVTRVTPDVISSTTVKTAQLYLGIEAQSSSTNSTLSSDRGPALPRGCFAQPNKHSCAFLLGTQYDACKCIGHEAIDFNMSTLALFTDHQKQSLMDFWGFFKVKSLVQNGRQYRITGKWIRWNTTKNAILVGMTT